MHPDDRKELLKFALKLRLARARSMRKNQGSTSEQMARVRAHATPESREKARLKLIGQKRSEESKEKMRKAALGRRLSEETKDKIRKALLGRKNPFAKNEHSFKAGILHPNWKGDEVGYRDLHLWVERQLGKPETCEHCHKTGLTGKRIHWANKSGEYKRDVTDWLRLCAPCHGKYDKVRFTS